MALPSSTTLVVLYVCELSDQQNGVYCFADTVDLCVEGTPNCVCEEEGSGQCYCAIGFSITSASGFNITSASGICEGIKYDKCISQPLGFE